MSPPDAHRLPRRSSVPAPLELIELVYEAAAEPSRWASWFDALATSIGHHASSLVVRGFGPTRYVDLDDPTLGFGTLNPASAFEHKALSKRSFEIAYVSGEIVEDWSHLHPDGAAPTGIEVFSDDARSLDRHDRSMLRTVLPHLHRAIVLHFRLDDSRRDRDTLSTCFDELSTAMMLLDANAKILHANRAALDRLGGECGLVCENGTLSGRGPHVNASFERNLETTTSGRQQPLCVQPLPGGTTLWLRGIAPGRAVAYITSERSDRELAPELLSDAFQLSPAEARVGSLFAVGKSVDEIAAELGISVHTVRLHVKKIQHKTGTNRQATLVRRILETIPPVHR